MKSPLKSPGHGGRLHLGADAAVHHRWQRRATAGHVEAISQAEQRLQGDHDAGNDMIIVL